MGQLDVRGQYVRVDVHESAEVTISPVSGRDAEYEVSGVALWRNGRAAPRVGTLNFVAKLQQNRLEHREVLDGELYRVVFHFNDDGLRIEEEGRNPTAAASVRFGGDYKRQEVAANLTRDRPAP